MKKIVGITILEKTGYGPIDFAHKETLWITRDSIRYVYEPVRESESNRPAIWFQRDESPEFKKNFAGVCHEIRELMNQEPGTLWEEDDTITLTVAFEDGTNWVRDYNLSPYDDDLDKCVFAIIKLIPAMMKCPMFIEHSMEKYEDYIADSLKDEDSDPE